MSKKAAILGLTTVALIAAAAVSYFGYTSAGPVDAASLVGAAAPRTGSHFKSPRVEVSVETGDRIDWDFRDVHSPYREKDSQGDWVDGTHVLKEEYCAGGNHPDDYFIAGYKMADFGLTDVGDNGYLLQRQIHPAARWQSKGLETPPIPPEHKSIRHRKGHQVAYARPAADPHGRGRQHAVGRTEERRQLRRPQGAVLLWPSIPLHRDTPGSGHANSRTTNRSPQYGSSGANPNTRG